AKQGFDLRAQRWIRSDHAASLAEQPTHDEKLTDFGNGQGNAVRRKGSHIGYLNCAPRPRIGDNDANTKLGCGLTIVREQRDEFVLKLKKYLGLAADLQQVW